jgi:putative ABC transport system permease protein
VRLLLLKTWRDVLRQRAQFAAITLTIGLGVALYGASFDAYHDLQASYAAMFDRLHFADVLAAGGDSDGIAAAARAVPGVEAAATRTVADVPVRVGDHELLGRVIGMPVTGQPPVDGVDVLSGRYLDGSEHGGVLVEQHFASYFHLAPGSRLDVHGPDGWLTVQVRAVVASAEYLWPAKSRQEPFVTPDDFGVLFVPEALARSLAGVDQPDQALVYLSAGARAQGLVDRLTRLADAHAAADVVTRDQQPSNATLQEDINGFGELSFLFPVLFLSAAGVATYLLLSRLVRAQRTQLGTLRGNGVRDRAIVMHYLSYGVGVGLVGGVLGALAGLALAGAITSAYTSEISLPVAVVELHPLTPLLGTALALLAGAAAALAPSLAALRVSPADAMRGQVPMLTGRRSLLERLAPLVRRLPAGGKLVLRGLERSPRRSLTVVIGVALALVLILSSLGLLDTTRILLARQFDDIQQQDAQVYAAGPVDQSFVNRVAAVDGVASVEPSAQLAVALRRGGQTYATSLVGLRTDTDMHRFYAADGTRLRLPARGILAGSALAAKLGIHPGDMLTVRLTDTASSFDETLSGFVDEPLGTYAYIALPELDRQLGSAAANSVLVKYAPNQDRASLRRRLAAVPGVVAVGDSRTLQQAADSLLGLFYAFVGLMLVFGGAIAFVLIFSAMSVGVAERTVELATLRAAGVRLSRISLLVTWENLGLTLIGLVPGLPLGIAAAGLFMASYSSDLFHFDLHIYPQTPVLAATAVLLAALLSQWPALRAIGRLNLAAVVRERSL